MLPPPTTDIRMACFICSQLVDPRAPNFLIECHFCGRWLHGACAQVTEQDALLITKFACVDCRQQQHQTEKYQQPNNASNAPYDADALSYAPLPVHLSGYASEPARLRHKKNSASFRRLLGAAIYARSGVHLVPSQDLTPSFLQRNALDEPVLIAGGSHNIAGLNEAFPVIDAATVTELLAKNHSVRTTDVATQTRQQLTSAAWQSEISEAEQQENQLTLPNAEFRLLRTPLQSKVDAPVAVTQVDWHNLLPNNDDGSGSTGNATNPNVFGVFLGANAYLDFVVAPGGQCTWLSVTGGELWVYLIPPTKENTVAFRDWKSDPDFATAFLPEKTEKCIKCVVSAGSTLLVPAGWMYARFAGSAQSCSVVQGYFACTAAMEAQLGAVLLELRHDVLAQYYHETTSGWLSVDANVQLWTAVCYYTRQLLSNDNNIGTHVSEQDRRALLRALTRLREWSALPASLKSVNGITWTPSSQREAQAIVGRLEQALGSTCVPTHSLDELQPTMGLVADSKLPPISPNEATYIYSAASAPDSGSSPPWGSGMDSSSSSFVSTPMWSEFSPIQTQPQDHLVISTHNQPFLNSDPALQQQSHSQNVQASYGGNAFGFMSTQGNDMSGAGSGYLTGPEAQGLEGLGSLGNLASQSLEPGTFGSTLAPAVATRSFQTRLDSNGNYVDVLMRHRASCHRCGNLRKKNVRCPVCPHIFCQKCAEKMIEEHGENIFSSGCPVCKELCCCGKNRTPRCTRKFHCYKKCPATKRPAAG